jgi:hypothetical protein
MGSRKQTSRDLEWIKSLDKATSESVIEKCPEGEGWKTFPELDAISPIGKHQLREAIKKGISEGYYEEYIGKKKNCLGNLYKVMFYRMKDAE